MARTVDPERHAARRMQIIDAALTRFSEDGYEGATTASICREAGIGSGTFFHYFPTKIALLLALLELGTADTRAWFGEQGGRADAAQVIDDWVAHNIEMFSDRRLAGFVRAVSAVMTESVVAEALSLDESGQREGLRPWLELAQKAGQVRGDLAADRLSNWVFLLIDGFVARLATDPRFDPVQEAPVLRDAVTRLLAP